VGLLDKFFLTLLTNFFIFKLTAMNNNNLREKVFLIKPYSIWTESFASNCIGIFYNYGSIWKESDGCIFGIGDDTIKYLLHNGIVVKSLNL
jgi:hypothetical protein